MFKSILESKIHIRNGVHLSVKEKKMLMPDSKVFVLRISSRNITKKNQISNNLYGLSQKVTLPNPKWRS